MNWLDVLVVMIIGVAVITETIRGFGRAAFDALALYGVLWLASWAAAPVSKVLPISGSHEMALAAAYGIVAVAGGVLGLILSHVAYGSLLLNAGMFDHFLGLIAGIAVGVMLSHGLTRSVAYADAGVDGSSQVVSSGVVSSELYDFHGYHAVLDQLTGAVSYHRELNPGGDH